MAVTIYKASDTDAPALTRTAGSLISVLKACLVDGYGTGGNTKAAAGWTVEIAGSTDILLKNAGSGRYWRIKDDGYLQTTTSTPVYGIATITGAKSYTDISTLITPFPRTISGSNRHSTTYYGHCIYKTAISANTGYSHPWVVIADDSTCYLIVCPTLSNQTAIDAPAFVYGFGDLGLLDAIASYPKAFVSGVGFTNGTNEASNFWTYNGLLSTGVSGYMENPLTGGAESTMYWRHSSKVHWGFPSTRSSVTFEGNGYVYPSPMTGGLVLEPVYIADDTANVVRTSTHSGYEFETFAKYRGVYRCLQRLKAATTGCIGDDEFITVEADSRTYYVVNVASSGVDDYSDISVAFDITGPW